MNMTVSFDMAMKRIVVSGTVSEQCDWICSDVAHSDIGSKESGMSISRRSPAYVRVLSVSFIRSKIAPLYVLSLYTFANPHENDPFTLGVTDVSSYIRLRIIPLNILLLFKV